ncbi:MAG: hypothetical protein GPJ51_07045 [Candidatus Heimdallarchaeota archaeon]|nr:hypothetical protein [Candidatus Heimdallarchaeota archaeon]
MSKGSSVKIECPKCDGNGWASIPPPKCTACVGTGKEICPSCNGTKQVSCTVCEGTGKIDCDECYGSGKIICAKCEGEGNLGEFQRERCDLCGGKGKVENINCAKCLGKGYVEKDPIKCNVCGGSGEMSCQYCEGSGKSSCPNCDLGKAVCDTCYGRAEISCSACLGTGGIGDEKIYLCDLCEGKGYSNIKISSVSSPDLDRVLIMIASLQDKVSEGTSLSHNELEKMIHRVEHSSKVGKAKYEQLKKKYKDVNSAIAEMQKLQKKIVKEGETVKQINLQCPSCAYIPGTELAEEWLESSQLNEFIICVVCSATFQINKL